MLFIYILLLSCVYVHGQQFAFSSTCLAHKVVVGDTCYDISVKYGIPISNIDGWNKNTWQWKGCNTLQVGMKICVSDGISPDPDVDPNAVCGITSKNHQECPLKACCSKWGYCGTIREFCENECQNNCQMEYKSTSPPPSSFATIGYYQSWTKMDLSDIDGYTHVHYAFGTIGKDLSVTGGEEFISAKTSYKKIISFGGWEFDKSLLQNALEPDNVDKFISNLIAYMPDGVDFDWEYPGAPDLPGTNTMDITNLVSFLRKLKARMPSDKTLSIAAPASFWYLKQYPIAEISQIVDYIVYMTYDLHGIWDATIPSLGPYLKSHVNLTETINALTMITKAGVPSNKIMMGVASYGRTFTQSDPQCSNPSCTFTGPGDAGPITQVAGFISNQEISDIISKGGYRDLQHDKDSDILLYGTNQWVAFMLEDRTELAKSMNLGGTAKWSINMEIMSVDFVDIPSFMTSTPMHQAVLDMFETGRLALLQYRSMMTKDNTRRSTIGPKFVSWLDKNLDKYFDCPAGPCSFGTSGDLKWVKKEEFYKNIKQDIGVERWWITTKTKNTPECIGALMANPNKCMNHEQHNYPALESEDIINDDFVGLFYGIYRPHMKSGMDKIYDEWAKIRNNIDRYFVCESMPCTKDYKNQAILHVTDDYYKQVTKEMGFNVTADVISFGKRDSIRGTTYMS